MKRILFVSSTLFIAGTVMALDISFEGSSLKVIPLTAEKSTGLNTIYVAFDTSQIVSMKIGGFSGNLNVSRFSNMGGGYAEEIDVAYEGSEAIVSNPEGDMGYIITDSQSSTYIWLVNYKNHYFQLNSAQAAGNQNCDNTLLDVSGNGGPIDYFTIDGRKMELSREIEVKYYNLEWSESSESFIQNSETKILNHLSNTIAITPPLYCNSTVTISGDRFLKEWGRGITVDTPLVYANGLAAQTTAVQTNQTEDDNSSSNIIRSETQGMGGSAPVEIEFRAFTTDAVIHNEWQIASDSQFEYVDYRFNEQNLDYTFNDEGTYYIRYIGSNSDGTCEVIGETYTVGVGSSELRIPNAFTPNDDGVNDEWKVAYRSLLEFHCTIFDRYGNELFKFDDPSKGWDGKYKGKFVNPGVYFYVIEAIGADGKKYKKGGDINIIKSKKYTGTNTPSVQ